MHEKDVQYVDELDRLKFTRHLRESRNVHLDDGAVLKVVLASHARPVLRWNTSQRLNLKTRTQSNARKTREAITLSHGAKTTQ